MRPVPTIGMEVRVIALGHTEHAEIEQVLDGGRVLVVAGERYALHPLTAHWVREGEPYYGRRLALTRSQPS